MLPLYRDHAVIVVRRAALSDLRAGMTAVYLDGEGRPVAHVLERQARGGWVARGLNNLRDDETLVCADNLVGVVVRAYQPSAGPLAALLAKAAAETTLASISGTGL
jgi:hypothetical protein